MTFRAYITLPGLPVDDEAAWEPFIEALERDAGELGPVIGWRGSDAEVILAADAADEAAAAAIATAAVRSALDAVRSASSGPSRIELEPIDEDG